MDTLADDTTYNNKKIYSEDDYDQGPWYDRFNPTNFNKKYFSKVKFANDALENIYILNKSEKN